MAASALIERLISEAMVAYYRGRKQDLPIQTSQRFPDCTIAIHADEHNPPHLHIEGKGWRVLVAIDGLTVMAGDRGRGGVAMAWAAENIDRLKSEWDRLSTLRE